MAQQKHNNNKYYAQDFRYYEFEIIYFYNKFGFRVVAFNPNMFPSPQII